MVLIEKKKKKIQKEAVWVKIKGVKKANPGKKNVCKDVLVTTN